jgi:hypothetical protein
VKALAVRLEPPAWREAFGQAGEPMEQQAQQAEELAAGRSEPLEASALPAPSVLGGKGPREQRVRLVLPARRQTVRRQAALRRQEVRPKG